MIFVFGERALDVDHRDLRWAGVVRPLEPWAFTVPLHLLTQCHPAPGQARRGPRVAETYLRLVHRGLRHR
jgi:hypothetical protein